MMMKNGLILFWILLLSGCTGGAVVFVPTSLPPDVSPSLFTHPSGAWSIVIPRNWSQYTQPASDLAAASFSPPNSSQPLVRVSVVNTGSVISDEALGGLMLQYQTQIRPDLVDYTEQDRQAMGDGSWRMTGVRTFQGQPQPLNTFLQKRDAFFAVMEVVIPRDPTLATDVQTFINTFTLNPDAALPPAALAVLATASSADLEVSHVRTWSGEQGVFFITGEVANRGLQGFGGVPVEARLLAADGRVLSTASDVLVGHGILPGGYAPFSLRFGGGQPIEAVNFELSVEAPTQLLTTDSLITAPVLTWTDQQEVGAQGQLYVTGTVTNTGSQTVNDVRMVVTVFDDTGSVIGVGSTTAAELLPSATTADWTLLVPALGGEPVQYIVNGQGLP